MKTFEKSEVDNAISLIATRDFILKDFETGEVFKKIEQGDILKGLKYQQMVGYAWVVFILLENEVKGVVVQFGSLRIATKREVVLGEMIEEYKSKKQVGGASNDN